MTIYLIRHAEAAKAWDEDPNPGLSDLGHSQAKELLTELNFELKNRDLQLLSSPLLRAQETARPFKEALEMPVHIQPHFAEIPSPGVPLAGRRIWLREQFSKPVTEFEPPQQEWRQQMISTLMNLSKDTLVFSHFLTINALVGWIQNKSELVSFYPAYCSVTTIERVGEEFKIVEFGKQLETVVQ